MKKKGSQNTPKIRQNQHKHAPQKTQKKKQKYVKIHDILCVFRNPDGNPGGLCACISTAHIKNTKKQLQS